MKWWLKPYLSVRINFSKLLANLIAESFKKNGKEIAQVPKEPTNRFGRPLFQGLQYSDTPLFPLIEMEFIDHEAHMITMYEVIAVNTVGLKSKPAIPQIFPKPPNK